MSARNTNRFLYNPSRLPEEDLIARFIVRKREYALLWEDISHTQRDGIDQHFLIIGQRGMGKTTLMLKVAYEIKRDPDLLEWLIPVNFPEELYGVQDLLGLWETLAEILEEQFPGLAKQVQEVAQDQTEHAALETIRKRVTQEDKKLILFIDNFGDLLDRLTDIEVHRLREILMSAGDIRLVAASARLMDQTYEYDKPFLDFFNTVFLDGLNREDTLYLMRGLAENSGKLSEFNAILEQHPSRVEAVRRLTGGVPRLLLLLFSSIMGDPDAAMMDDLEDILDQVSPYYKHRVEELSSQHRSIFHHVAMAWDAVGAGEVATAMRTDSRKVSAQLQQLIDNDLLEKIETWNRNYLYRIRERFFNIWYLLRMAGARGASRMKWLVGFLETWLDQDALRHRLEEFAVELRGRNLVQEASEVEEALREEIQRQFEEKFARNGEFLELQDSLTNSEKWFQTKLRVLIDDLEYAPDSRLASANKLIKDAPSWEWAVQAISKMREASLTPNVVTYTTMISRAPDWDAATWAFEEMARQGVHADVVTFNTMISRAPDWEAVFWAFEEMGRQGVQADVVTFNTMISSAPDWDSVLWTVQSMIQLGISPNHVTYIVLWSQAKSHGEMLELLEQMKGHWEGELHDPKGDGRGTISIDSATIALWECDFPKANMLARAYFEGNAPKKLHGIRQEFYLLTLLVRYQHQECLHLFESSPHRLKDVFKPIWYALQKLLGEAGRKELLRMGPELEETVDEIVDWVQQMRKKFPG